MDWIYDIHKKTTKTLIYIGSFLNYFGAFSYRFILAKFVSLSPQVVLQKQIKDQSSNHKHAVQKQTI